MSAFCLLQLNGALLLFSQIRIASSIGLLEVIGTYAFALNC